MEITQDSTHPKAVVQKYYWMFLLPNLSRVGCFLGTGCDHVEILESNWMHDIETHERNSISSTLNGGQTIGLSDG